MDYPVRMQIFKKSNYWSRLSERKIMAKSLTPGFLEIMTHLFKKYRPLLLFVEKSVPDLGIGRHVANCKHYFY